MRLIKRIEKKWQEEQLKFFPNIVKTIDSQIQEVQRTQNTKKLIKL